MNKKRTSRKAVYVRTLASAPTHGGPAPTISLDVQWRARLHKALDGILAFSVSYGDKRMTIRGDSPDGRTILELIEKKNGVLAEASLQLALGNTDHLEAIKLGCWTLLYLTALFPAWANVREWIKEAISWATETGDPFTKHCNGYRIVCGHDPDANVVDFRVIEN